MSVSALLLLAILAPAPQEPPATAPPPATAEDGSPIRATPAVTPEAPAAASAPAPSGDPLDNGLALYKKRRFKQAEAEFRRAVEADPQNAAAEYYLGYTIYKIAEPRRPNHPGKAEAAEHFAKAYSLDPAFKPTWRPTS
jgi:tetratricopeptide (TPR) repeat protein